MEYDVAGQPLPSAMLALDGFDVPCAVCQRISLTERGTMIPGLSDECPPEFVSLQLRRFINVIMDLYFIAQILDYSGVLFGTGTGRTRSEWLCLDSSAHPAGSCVFMVSQHSPDVALPTFRFLVEPIRNRVC